ncbi:MAG: DNA repair protein RecN [Thermodesulfobacteriota bacterium]|nr:DNA repair protein RecN [Thermodesulfobacteriota bacterium]
MLTELSIKNFAIIDELNVFFTKGLNVISGETGAGKSIIIGAVSLLLGDRASSDFVRTSEDSAVVEALFDVSDNEDIREKLKEAGMGENNELVLKRVVSRGGRNRIYINGNLATLGMLSSLGESLVNICGQREHQVLLDADNHIDILDEFGGLMPLRSEFAGLYSDWQALEKKLDKLKAKNNEKREREELLRFQLDELEKSGLKIGEDLSLQDEKRILGNAKKLDEYAGEAHDILYASEGSVLEKLDGVVGNIKEIRKIDPGLKISEKELESAFFNLEEVAFALRDYVKGITFDPARLEEIDDRLEYLGKLKRKYGETIENILRRKEEIGEELEGMAYLGEEIARISEEIDRREKLLLEKAEELSGKRRGASEILKKAIKDEIHSMMMADTVFDVRFANHPGEGNISSLNSKGVDEVEFYLSTNVGEELMPLNRIASGGELSRIVLAMKKALAGSGSIGTVVFDEVDSGIGGAAAEVVGKKLKEVSRHHQVICITHLPQIACFGDTHFLVSKEVNEDRTNAVVDLLSDPQRLDEITRMLAGVEITEKTREHASEMLKMSRE